MADRTIRRDPADSAGRLAYSPSGIIGLGALAVVAGVLVLAWPGVTLRLIAVIFALFLLVFGTIRLISAIASEELTGGGRVLLAFLGIIAILVGILCLRHPFQTLTVLVLLLGLFWILGGVLEAVHALGSPGMPGRGWSIAAGVVSLAAGIVVLAYSTATLVVLTWLLGLELILYGVITVGRGVQAHRELRSSATPVLTPRGTA
ncbi:MAG TPA: DUF308 domain-containing protein [Amycolatopsis sp.]|jgi:uncharacterized membrane protein HdeD (DUF308 family)|nr:DUF308 domain-containing protein [Amycolatopsis sp.]